MRTPHVCAALVLALATGALSGTVPAAADPAGTELVISEAYVHGGSADAAYTHKFVELHNPTAETITLGGLALLYRSATGTGAANGGISLVGSVPPGGYFLIQAASNGSGGAAPVPEPDMTTTAINPAATGGTLALVDGLSTVNPGLGTDHDPAVLDLLGYGTSNTYETAPAAASTLTTSMQREDDGDTDDNFADFGVLSPSPGEEFVPPEDDPTDASIAEIQGTGAASPLDGERVRTAGTVTATYPAGGLAGFYLQTDGTGSGDDRTPGASDAIFVYGPEAVEAAPSPGTAVQVTGTVAETGGLTQIVPDVDGVEALPGEPDPVTPLAEAYPTATADREAHEGELFAPTDSFTVTNTFPTNAYGEVGLATGERPLRQPTDVAPPGTAEYDAVVADNAARGVVLDDGAGISFLSGANRDIPLPWLRPDNPVRVGARATLHAPVVLDFRNNVWKLQPTRQVTGSGSAVATFANTRTEAPEPVGGDLRLATFNVLNYFDTTGEDFVAAGGACSYHTDRAGDPVTVDECTPDGPRGAAEAEDLQRQRAKVVAAINALGADIVSLSEIENSVRLLGETDRDGALADLVGSLNEAAGADRWAYVPSPASLPETAEQDVIRTAFIYNPDTTEPVGDSAVLVGDPDFANAREPLAQAFKRAGAADGTAFAVVANHFKSKSDSTPPATGDNADGPQGAFNGDRVRQAASLVEFAGSFAAQRGTEKVFLVGDFNSYTAEDPMQVLYRAGFTKVGSDTPGETSYSFAGLSGSLDHVLANDAALETVTGADLWQINAEESPAFEYSRHNYNATDFYASNPFRSSDHNPEVVGITADGPVTDDVRLNLLAVNDFHGRINANTVKWAGTVEKLTADAGEAPTLFVGAGDLIGASEFASAVQQDQPTIDVMNALGLDASAVGNHEFDQGWADLRDRVIGPAADRNATWEYLGANVYARGTQDPVLPEYALFSLDGVEVAVVGAVTEETGSLVSPGGIADLEFGNAVDAVNRVARRLSDGDPDNGEAELIVASFHAGAQQGAGSDYQTELAKGGEFAEMASLVPAVDVILNGHTHQAYAWDAPVPGDPGRTRPILQTGQYAENVGQVDLTVDPETGEVTAYAARNVARLTTPDEELVAAYPRVAQVKQIVDAALERAAEIGNQPVGEVTDDVTRAFANGSFVDGRWVAPPPRTEDRAAESSLGDLVADALRAEIPAGIGAADLGIVNPGGLRADLLYAGDTSSNPANTDGVVTYAEANSVLPFVNNIWLVDLTGAELRAVLEQQWQPAGASRPFLQLGLSDNVQVTLDPSEPQGSRVTSLLVDGAPVDPEATYTVSTFSFLATGGDNFTAFTAGDARDTGLVDRDLWIGYLREAGAVAPDFARQQVYETGLPSTVAPAEQVAFTLSRLDMTSLGSPQNTLVRVTGGGTELAEVPVSGGVAEVAFTVPAGLADGTVTVTAEPSGTSLQLPVSGRAAAQVTAVADPAEVRSKRQTTTVSVQVSADGHVPTGQVEVLAEGQRLAIGDLADGAAALTVGPFETLGAMDLQVRYLGDARTQPASTVVTVHVKKAAWLSVSHEPERPVVRQTKVTMTVDVTGYGGTPTGEVVFSLWGRELARVPVEDGTAVATLGPFWEAGWKYIHVDYSGDSSFAAARKVYKVEAVDPAP